MSYLIQLMKAHFLMAGLLLSVVMPIYGLKHGETRDLEGGLGCLSS